MQTSLAVASDDMDNATNGNVANLKAEAGKLIQTHKAEMGMVCALFQICGRLSRYMAVFRWTVEENPKK